MLGQVTGITSVTVSVPLAMRTRRVTRLQQQNTLTASTRVFPVEILCHIFSYVLCGNRWTVRQSQREFMRLGHICSHWRDVILSAPKLWSQFTIYFRNSSDEVPDLQLLLLYVNNSGNSPFLLGVFFEHNSSLHLPMKTIQKLHECVSKVHTLILDGVCWSPMQGFPQIPMSWLSMVENLNLTSGAFFSGRSINPRILLNGFTHLRKLQLEEFGYPRDVQLPWEQITSSKLDYWPVDHCMSLLVRCPNLVEFHALNCRRSKKPHMPRLSDYARKLEHMSWGFDTSSVCKFLSHELRFPFLRTLYWHSPDPSNGLAEEEMSALRSLVSNFPPNISQLHLFDAEAWSDEFTEFVFVKLKGLKMIRFHGCRTLVQFLSLLNRMNDWEGCCVLPLLAEIDVYPYNEYYAEDRAQMEEEIASHMVPLFHFRDPHKTRQFSLHIVQYERTVSEGLHEAYVSLKKDGYAFKIWYYDNRLSKVPLPD